MKLAINAVSAKRGGAVTYLQNMLPALRSRLANGPNDCITVWRGETTTADERWPLGIDYREDVGASGGLGAVGGPFRRLWFDQVSLPLAMKRESFDALFSSANFGPLVSPGRHVLLVRNAAYFDPTFLKRIPSPRVRAYYLAQRWLTLRCIESADVVLFPSEAMRDLVRPYARRSISNWRVAHYGTRHEAFRRIAPRTARAIGDPVQLLNVSIYSDQKNFGTLLAAAEKLRATEPRGWRLRLTAGFGQDWLAASEYFPRFASEREAFRGLEREGLAEDVDWKRYGTLPSLYHSAHIFVFPSYIESFGHPLLEAMAAELPIVAADVPVNRELCGDAAVYFSTFDADACAAAIRRVASESGLAERLSQAGARRVRKFTWERHVDVLVAALQAS